MNINTILSNQLLMIAAALLIISPLVFLVALIKFLKVKKQMPDLPSFSIEENEKQIEDFKNDLIQPAEPVKKIIPEPITRFESPEPSRAVENMDKTVVMAPGSGEIQGQIEIAFSQIKTLNKKVRQMEGEMEALSRTAAAKLDTNELKEVPMNPADFTQKLLKLAEHVIVLEKEVARLKSNGKAQGATSGVDTSDLEPLQSQTVNVPKNTIMPI